jgi:ABC-2 type transport system permease protein
MEVKHHWLVFIEYIKINIATAMEYRFNFLVQTFSMVLNDAIWIVFWLIFFEKFNIVKGWGLNEILMLWAVMATSFGFSAVVFGNKTRLAENISNGHLDFYLNLPVNVLFHSVIGKSSWFGVGDIIFGITIAIFTLELSKWPIFILLCFISSFILLAFAIIIGSLSFYFGNAYETSRNLWMGFITFGTYPISIFQNPAKIILLTLVPAGFISSVPVTIIKDFSLKWFALMLFVTTIFMLVSIVVFYHGLKKYESGSMITVRI